MSNNSRRLLVGLVMTSVFTFTSILANVMAWPILAKAEFTTGEWVYQDYVTWVPEGSSVSPEYNGGDEVLLINREDDITFISHCEFPGNIIPGGEEKHLNVYITAQDKTFDFGYRGDFCYLAVADSEISNPEDELSYTSSPVPGMIVDENDPGVMTVNGSVWHDPVDEDNYGSELESRNMVYTFPTGTSDGQVITLWFVKWGNQGENGAIGLRYKWQSATGLTPAEDRIVNVNIPYTGSESAWVLTSYEMHPYGRDIDVSYPKNCYIYDDSENGKFIVTYTKANGLDSWTNFEMVVGNPPAVLKEGDEFALNIHATAMGGHKRVGSDAIYLDTGKNLDSWKDASSYMDVYDINGENLGHSFSLGGYGEDDEITVAYKREWQYMPVGESNDDRWTVTFYGWNTPWVLVFNYKWVEKD